MVKWKVFVPTMEKLEELARIMLDGREHFSDNSRTPEVVWGHIHYWFGGQSKTVAFECDGGVMIIRDIVPGFKANVFLIITDTSKWGKSVWREGVDVLRRVMSDLRLAKVEIETANDRWAGFLESSGFEMEGKREKSFMVDGEMKPFYLLSLYGR